MFAAIAALFLLLEFLVLQFADFIFRHLGDLIKDKLDITNRRFVQPEKLLDLEDEIFRLKRTIREFEERPSDPIEVRQLKKTIEELNTAIHQAYITEQRLKAENASKDAAVEKFRKEAETVRAEWKRSEELLKSELDDVVSDLIKQEDRRREKIQDEQDEALFDQLSDVSDEFPQDN